MITPIFPKLSATSSRRSFRSLAGELGTRWIRQGYDPGFSEFLWADFLRRRMKRQNVDKDFDAALEEALTLAQGDGLNYLPGWCGPINDD